MHTGLTQIARRAAMMLPALALGMAVAPTAHAQDTSFQAAFDSTLGTQARAPRSFDAVYDTPLAQQIAQIAEGSRGRIGVAAIDLSSGERISVLGDQRFPMASTSKVAIAATFLAGVDEGRWSLTSEFPLLIPVRSEKYSSTRAPVREGNYLPASELIELMISRSSNASTDALLRVVGGPSAVNAYMRRAGIRDFELTRDIATLVRDDGEFDPATVIDRRDSASPNAMATLLADIYQGKLLSARSRDVLIGAMERTTTGKRRIRSGLPEYAQVAHKTGTLNRTASDIGIFHTADGRAIAVAIYVTGQSMSLQDEASNKTEARRLRDERISSIANALYSGLSNQDQRWANAQYGAGG